MDWRLKCSLPSLVLYELFRPIQDLSRRVLQLADCLVHLALFPELVVISESPGSLFHTPLTVSVVPLLIVLPRFRWRTDLPRPLPEPRNPSPPSSAGKSRRYGWLIERRHDSKVATTA